MPSSPPPPCGDRQATSPRQDARQGKSYPEANQAECKAGQQPLNGAGLTEGHATHRARAGEPWPKGEDDGSGGRSSHPPLSDTDIAAIAKLTLLDARDLKVIAGAQDGDALGSSAAPCQ